MNTTSVPGREAMAQDVPISLIVPGANTRKRFDQKALEELAANIKEHSVLQPILVRPWIATKEDLTRQGEHDFQIGDGIFQLVAGERRLKASVLAGLTTVPAMIRNLSDGEVKAINLVENLQREDVHPLDEATGFKELLSTSSLKSVSQKVSRDEPYVTRRLQLLTLIPEVRKVFYADRMKIGHAEEIARLEPREQARVLKDIYRDEREDAQGFLRVIEYKNPGEILKDPQAQPAMSLRQLKLWIQQNVHRDLTKAPFDVTDAQLLPEAGPCTDCPFKAGNAPNLFPDIQRGDTCTRGECYETKKTVLVQLRISDAKEPVQRISTEWYLPPDESHSALLKDALGRSNYTLAKKECQKTKAAIYVDEGVADEKSSFGKLTRICLDPAKCPNHGFAGSHSRGQEPTSAEKAKRRKESFERKVQNVFRKRLAIAVREKLPSKIGDGEIPTLAKFVLKNLGYARRKAVAACYGFGSDLNSTQSEKALEKHFAGLKAADLVKFALICTMMDDLEIASYQKVRDLERDHPLVVAARAYKVDMAKLYDSTKLELTPKAQRLKQKAEPSDKPDQKKAKTSNQRKAGKDRKES